MSRIVPVTGVDEPPTTNRIDSFRLASDAGLIVITVEVVTELAVADSLTAVLAETPEVSTANVTKVLPAGTVTVAGAETA